LIDDGNGVESERSSRFLVGWTLQNVSRRRPRKLAKDLTWASWSREDKLPNWLSERN
jgi:hypothetical protein